MNQNMSNRGGVANRFDHCLEPSTNLFNLRKESKKNRQRVFISKKAKYDRTTKVGKISYTKRRIHLSRRRNGRRSSNRSSS